MAELEGAPSPRLALLPQYLSDEMSAAGREFLVENIGVLHDAKIRIGSCTISDDVDDETVGVTFRCFQSLVEASRIHDVEGEEEGEDGDENWDDDVCRVEEYEAFVTALHLSISEDRWLAVLVGTVAISELCESNSHSELFDVIDILLSLGMKKLVWYICQQVKYEVTDFQEAFLLFQAAYERYEDDSGSTSYPPRFASVMTHAAYLGLKKLGAELLVPSNRDALIWLISHQLAAIKRISLDRISQHPQLLILDDQLWCKSPQELIGDYFERIVISRKGANVELQSMIDGNVFRTHIEALALVEEFVRLLLRSSWAESEKFEKTRSIVVEELSTASCLLLSQFAYVGRFLGEGEHSPHLVDVLLLLRHAERFPDDVLLTRYCLQYLKRARTSDPEFLQQLAEVGTIFEDFRLKLEVVKEWASQEVYSEEELIGKIAQAAQSARTQHLASENETLQDEVSHLKEEVINLKKAVSTQQFQLQDQERRLQQQEELLSGLLKRIGEENGE